MKSQRFITARTWIVRVILVFGTLLYFLIGRLFLVDPADTIGHFGLTAPLPESMTMVRAIVGGFFLGLSATALYGLVMKRRTVASLWVIVTFVFCVLIGRVTGVLIDGAVPLNLSELRNETQGFIMYSVALLLAPRQT